MVYINSTVFGSITIDNQTYGDDIIILADGTIEKRGLQKGTYIICLEEVNILFESKPKIIVIGTGQSGVAEIEPKVVEKAKKLGIKIIEAPTLIAIKKFNSIKEKKAGLFHLAC